MSPACCDHLEKGRGILFVLRIDDGTIVIPPGSTVDPRGVL